MSRLSGASKKLASFRPVVRTAFVVHLDVEPGQVILTDDEVDRTFSFRDLTDPNDSLVADVVPRWQQGFIRSGLGDGSIEAIVAMDGDKPVGRIWELYGPNRGRLTGVPRVEIAPGEVFLFDLFVARGYRRGGLAMNMGQRMLAKHLERGTRRAFGFIMYDNAPSIMWHYGVGFQATQLANFVSAGPRVLWKVPLSDTPRFGPMSASSTLSEPDRQLVGLDLLAADRRRFLPRPDLGDEAPD